MLINFFSLIDYLDANHLSIMAASVRRFLSRTSSSSSSSTSPLESSIVRSKEIYASGTIPNGISLCNLLPSCFKTTFSVRTHEETISLNDQCRTFQLLSRTSINKYLQKGFGIIISD